MGEIKPVPIWPGGPPAPAPSTPHTSSAAPAIAAPPAYQAPNATTHPVDPWGYPWGGKSPAAAPVAPAETARVMTSIGFGTPAPATAAPEVKRASTVELDKDSLDVIDESIASGDKWIVVYDGNRAVASYSPALGKPALVALIAEALRQNPERTLDLQA